VLSISAPVCAQDENRGGREQREQEQSDRSALRYVATIDAPVEGPAREHLRGVVRASTGEHPDRGNVGEREGATA
jgi:hypothetical protein